jgi:hypothetical protein
MKKANLLRNRRRSKKLFRLRKSNSVLEPMMATIRFAFFIEELAVIHDAADRRFGVRADFY